MTRKEFYHSQEWRRARDAYIRRRIALDGGMCEVCHDAPGRIVHHKLWLTDDNVRNIDVSLNFNNFRYECQTCHNREVDPSRRVPGRCRYGPDGEILPN